MRKAIIVRGKLRGGRVVELEEPVEGVDDDVEVVLRLQQEAQPEESESPVVMVRRDQLDPLLHPENLQVEVVAEQRRSTGLGSTTEIVMARRVGRSSAESTEEEDDGTRDTMPDPEEAAR